MRHEILFQEGSLNDFQAGLDYYERISINLADRFEEKFWQKIDEIKENPQHFQIRFDTIRIAFVDGFPFSVHFIFDDNLIQVIRILHTKRNY